jgi:hypothetical protein
MIDEQLLRQGLQKLLKDTEAAIRDRLADEPTLEANLRERHAAAVRAERTEGSAKGYNAFADEAITQAAVHWLLGCVFVRFLEDNGWLDERNAKVAWIAGPAGRLAIAKDRRTLFLRPDPNLTDRDYLLHAFAEVAKLPGVAGLFDPKYNPLYSLQPATEKGRGAARIVEFFQQVDPDTGSLVFDFTDPAHGTRFLGDLYQNLSESARKRYALCQTPSFVIDFILDRTLTPALDAFGLATVRMIDPSCGSGHFLLAAFSRLFRLWQGKEPGTNPPALVQRSLDAVYGVDLNPFAVEISRFRLLIAALESSGIDRLRDAPNFIFNLASGDSLLHGSRVGGGGIERSLFEDRLQHFYETEDAEELKRILGQSYHVVVGNPPYINVSDAILREAYRSRFATCHGKYQLGVPFTERFFDLTLRSESPVEAPAGWMGMIVSNAFMKRSFGKKLIESYLRNRDLTHVIDTSGPHLDAHGTPTVILIGRNREPLQSTIRAVRGKRGETIRPEDPSRSPIWLEIQFRTDQPGFDGAYVSVDDVPRESFAAHPWSIGGGGAAELRESIEESAVLRLIESCDEIGVQVITGEEDVFSRPRVAFERAGIREICRFVTGDDIRNWTSFDQYAVFNPYTKGGPDSIEPASKTSLWRWRTSLSQRKYFGQSQIERGLKWWEYSIVMASRQSPPVLAIADLATHNNAFFANLQTVFDQHAPVIKLVREATRNDYIGLLGLLNSSMACFWLKQVCHNRGTGGIGGGLATESWERFYEFDNTRLKQFPLPADRPTLLAELIQGEAETRDELRPEALARGTAPTREILLAARESTDNVTAKMVTLQEELDWKCYYLYGLLDDDLTLPPTDLPPLKLGERAFEIIMAREREETTWFQRHHSIPITDLPSHWPDAYRRLVERRIEVIENDRDIALIERPEHKRRWNFLGWQEMEQVALKNWLLDRIEVGTIWRDHTLLSCAQLRDSLARDPDWITVAELYSGGAIDDLDSLVIRLITPEGVPSLPVLRYTETGMRKRAEWEQVWKLQREEDAGANAEIPVPPKYSSKDFRRADYWRLRGSLDVPKERFILYQGFQRDSDETLVLGWAGWSHLEQAKALAAYYQRMRTEEGWEPERLKPILAGLLDLREWLKQWHDALDPETGLKLGTYFAEFAEVQCQELGFSPQESSPGNRQPARRPAARRRANQNDHTARPIRSTRARQPRRLRSQALRCSRSPRCCTEGLCGHRPACQVFR